LNVKIEHYLAASDLVSLYERVLERWEQDYETDSPALVRGVMSLLYAAREGLSEKQLLELLGSKKDPLPHTFWLPLYLAAERSFMNRFGYIGFFHEYLRAAVGRRYMANEQPKEDAHRALATMYHSSLFASSKLKDRESPDVRALKYLPLHAFESRQPTIWIQTMTDFAYLEAVVAFVDVGIGSTANDQPIAWHDGYFIVMDAIESWLACSPQLAEVKELIHPLHGVWTRHPEFIKSEESVMPTLYHDLKSMESIPARELFDRAKRRIIVQSGPLWTWCEREREKYEEPNKPWGSAGLGSYASEKCVAFISYRREGGSETARAIREGLLRHGIHTFLDVDDLRSHHFDERLLKEIEKAPSFIVILTPGCLDKCSRERDWLRLEIAHAIKEKKNIVPILKNSFNFPPPESLPPDIADLPRHNAVPYVHEYFEASIQKLMEFLRAG
jgi:hypothetical protein